MDRREEVEKSIGAANLKLLLAEINDGKITKEDVKMISRKMKHGVPAVFDDKIIESTDLGKVMLYMLDRYYRTVLYKEGLDGLANLKEILTDEDIELNSLAQDMKPTKRESHMEKVSHGKLPNELPATNVSPLPQQQFASYPTFEEVKHLAPETVIPNVSFLVTKVSPIQRTSSGRLQICGLKDTKGNKISMNLYGEYTNILRVGNVFNATCIQNSIINRETRLLTTEHTKLSAATAHEIVAFKEVTVADNTVHGTIREVTEIKCYYRCATHWKIIDDDGKCQTCRQKPGEATFDFEAKLTVDGVDVKLLIFKRSARMNESNKEAVEKKLAELEGKKCSVEFEDKRDGNDVAILKSLCLKM